MLVFDYKNLRQVVEPCAYNEQEGKTKVFHVVLCILKLLRFCDCHDHLKLTTLCLLRWFDVDQ